MVCKICNVTMNPGTTYEQKKNNKDKGWKRFDKCPKCNRKIYNDSNNFQDVLVLEKRE